MKTLITTFLKQRAAARLERRQAEIEIAIEYAQSQIRAHRDRLDELFVEQSRLTADLQTIDLPGRRRGGPLARLGVPSCGRWQ